MTLTREQLALGLGYGSTLDVGLRDAAASENKSLPIHRWVPWIAGFSAPFVEDAIKAYLPKAARKRHLVLDPFAGVGTTLVESLKAGHDAVGYEINPFAALATASKLKSVDVPPEEFTAEIDAFSLSLLRFEERVDEAWSRNGGAELASILAGVSAFRPANFRSRIPFFSRPVEAKFLYALARTQMLLEPGRTLFRAALGATMVSFSNYSYEPSLASRPGSGKALIDNASVGIPVSRKLREMLTDIYWARQNYAYTWMASRREIIQDSYFNSKLAPGSVSLVVTSPPYMNNYHYVRNTRPQLYWLGLLEGLPPKELEQSSFGKFWQTVRHGERVNLDFDNPAISQLLDRLRALHPDKGYYGGAGWANYVATYLNDSNKLMRSLSLHLHRGGRAVIVIGNSIIQGMEFPVDRMMAQLAESHGLAVEELRIVRTKRVGTSIIDSSVRNGSNNGHRDKTQLYDAALVLRK